MTPTFPRLYEHNRGRLAAAIIAFVIVQALALGVSAFATRHVFSALHAEKSEGVMIALSALICAGALGAASHILAAWNAEKLGQSFAISFRRSFYEQLSRLPKSTLEKRRVGALAIRFVGDLATMREWTSKGLVGVITAAIIVPTSVGVLWILSPDYAVTVLFALLATMLMMANFGRGLPQTHQSLRRERARLSIDMMERVGAAPDLRLLGRLKADQKLLQSRGDKLSSAASQRARQVAILRSIPDIAMGGAAATILWITATSGLGAAGAAASLAVISILVLPLRELATVWDLFCSWRIARQKSLAIFELPVVPIGEARAKLAPGPLDLEFDGRLSGDTRSFRVKIPAGSKTVLVGDEQRIRLLMDVFSTAEAPSSGALTIGGTRASEIRAKDIETRIHYLTLESPILQGSLRRALTMGCRRRPDDEKTLAAIESFGLDDALTRLGDLSGRIYEGGRNLSTQEVFRLLMARAFLAQPSVLLADLPTAMMDAQTLNIARDFIDGCAATCVLTSFSDGLVNAEIKTSILIEQSAPPCSAARISEREKEGLQR